MLSLGARGGGYVLGVDPGAVDAVRFERLAASGQTALGRGEAAAAAGYFRQALGLWRGRALAGVGEVEPLAREAARLEELRLVAVEGRIEADIELGLHAEVIGELEGLAGEYPLRERLWRLLVLALYRAGRQADALAAYRRARDLLAAELGLEPGEELRRLEQAVLRHEVPAAPPPRQHNLPAPLTSFLGREQDLARVEKLLGQARLVTLTGTGGTGKTRLAVEAGARLVGRFRDGVWLAELAGVAEPALVAAQVMAALGVRQAGDVPVLEALIYRLRSAELLLVLDNCEHLLDACAELAGALLRAAPGLRVLATSREPLGIPGEVELPGAAAGPAARARRSRSSAGARPGGAAVPGPRGGGARRDARAGGGAGGGRRADLPRRWTGCRWRSSWPRRGWARCRRRRSRRTWRTGSGSWPTGGPPRIRGIRRCGRRWTGAMTCWTPRSAGSWPSCRCSPAPSAWRRQRRYAPAGTRTRRWR